MPAQTIVIPDGRGYDVVEALKARAKLLASMDQYRVAADLQELALNIDPGA